MHKISQTRILCAVDGEQLESKALSIRPEGDLALERSVFPETVSPSLVPNQFTPLCGFQDGTVFPAKHSIPYEYARRSTAKLSIFCDQGATLISLNDQEYFAIPGTYQHWPTAPSSVNQYTSHASIRGSDFQSAPSNLFHCLTLTFNLDGFAGRQARKEMEFQPQSTVVTHHSSEVLFFITQHFPDYLQYAEPTPAFRRFIDLLIEATFN